MKSDVEPKDGPSRRGRDLAKVATIVVGLLGLFTGLGYLGYRWAESDALAVLSRIQGELTERDRKEEIGEWFEATLGDEFTSGDGARTTKTTEAHFQLFSGALLHLKSASQIRFGKRGGSREAVGLTVEVGEVDVRTKTRTLTINSQFGEVVIEPNSLIRLKREGDELLLSVEVGGLTLTGEGDEATRLRSGEEVTVAIGGLIVDAPAPPRQPAKRKEEEPKEALDLDVGDGVGHADLVITAGQSCTVHDPRPPTNLGIRFDSICSGPGRVTIDKQKTEAESQGNLRLPMGLHKYAVHCLDAPADPKAGGYVRVLRDAGTKLLPTFTPQANITTDGRRYTVLYQSKLPQVTVSWAGAPEAEKYFLVIDGQSLTVSQPTYTLRSGRLQPGTHKLAFRAVTSPPRQSRTTTIVVKYDVQASTARLSQPAGGFAPGSRVPVAGQALPGWTVSVNGSELELDSLRHFRTEVPTNGTLAITFSHPERGTHYYLRRPAGGN